MEIGRNFGVRVITPSIADMEAEFKRVGIDPEAHAIMGRKALNLCVKAYGLKPAGANILKQEALATGCDAAVNRGCVDCSADISDAIIMGHEGRLRYLASKIKAQPFGLSTLSEEIEMAVERYTKALRGEYPRWDIPLSESTDRKVLVMGILNVTPDSFSDGGMYLDPDKAIARGLEMAQQGADIIDVGGESTRPFSEGVGVEEEKKRVLPVIKALARSLDTPISIDTSKAEVAEAAIEAGAVIVNDVFGLRGEGMADVVAEHGAAVVIMHMKGRPRDMQKNPHYDDLMGEIYDFLAERADFAVGEGIRPEKIAIDPGIGFGKSVGNNYEIIRRLREFTSLPYPILIGPSRKSFIGAVSGEAEADKRLPGTISAVTAAVLNGARVVRVHDVAECTQAVRIAEAIMEMS